MDLKNRLVIVNVCSEDTWHKKGQTRLVESLCKAELDAVICFRSYKEPKLRNWYEDKIEIVRHIGKLGYKKIIWMDASITLIEGRSIQPILDYAAKHGAYLYPTGYKSGQTANTAALEYFETNTNEQMDVIEAAGNFVCIDLNHSKGKDFWRMWTDSLNSDSNLGIKWPAEHEAISENPDPRFLFSRHCQTTATLSAWRAGIEIDMDSLYVYRYGEENIKETSIFRLKGGE